MVSLRKKSVDNMYLSLVPHAIICLLENRLSSHLTIPLLFNANITIGT